MKDDSGSLECLFMLINVHFSSSDMLLQTKLY